MPALDKLLTVSFRFHQPLSSRHYSGVLRNAVLIYHQLLLSKGLKLTHALFSLVDELRQRGCCTLHTLSPRIREVAPQTALHLLGALKLEPLLLQELQLTSRKQNLIAVVA